VERYSSAKGMVYPSKGRRGKCGLTERRGRNEKRGVGRIMRALQRGNGSSSASHTHTSK